jgi:hypothetical protein
MMLMRSSGDTGADKDVMDALTYNASSSIRETFEANYEGINRCNQALNIAKSAMIRQTAHCLTEVRLSF